MEKPNLMFCPDYERLPDFEAASHWNQCWEEWEAYHRQSTQELLERISRKLVRHQNDKRLSAIMNEFIDAELAKLEENG